MYIYIYISEISITSNNSSDDAPAPVPEKGRACTLVPPWPMVKKNPARERLVTGPNHGGSTDWEAVDGLSFDETLD